MPLAANTAPGFQDHPDHEVTCESAAERVRVVFAGETVADSRAALRVEETGYRPVYYIPMADVRRAFLRASEHRSYCPFKGEAGYWSLAVGERIAENALWGYEKPFDECAALKDHVAFYGDRVDAVYLDEVAQPPAAPGREGKKPE